MKIRRIKVLVANGWLKVVCLVSYSLFSIFCGKASAQENTNYPVAGLDSISEELAKAISNLDLVHRQERNQGYRARAYGPQYPQSRYPLLVLDGSIIDTFSVDMQCLDSIVSYELYFDEAAAARLFGIKEREIKSVSVLKDAAATAIWGMRGANGVIEVRTKNDTHIGDRIRGRDDDLNKYAWESINEEIQKEYSKTELDSLPGDGLYIPSDHATYYSIEDFYNNWILK